MRKLQLDGTMWYGLDRKDVPVAISHESLMEWAKENGCAPEINCSDVVRLKDGTRLVRGYKAIKQADTHGWQDIADGLAAEVEGSVREGAL